MRKKTGGRKMKLGENIRSRSNAKPGILLLVSFLFVGVVAACSGESNESAPENENMNASAEEENAENQNAEEQNGSGDANRNEDDNDGTEKNGNEEDGDESVSVDQGLFDVEITLPASFFEEEVDVDDMIADAEESGVEDITVHEDGSVTYQMSNAVHQEMMEDMATDIDNYTEEVINDEDFVSINDITYEDDFSTFTMVVDQEAFENSFDGFAAFGLGLQGMFYQVFDGVDPEQVNVTIDVEDVDTGDVFNTIVYPDDMEDIE